MAIWNILWIFGIYYDHSVHFPSFGITHKEKSATLAAIQAAKLRRMSVTAFAKFGRSGWLHIVMAQTDFLLSKNLFCQEDKVTQKKIVKVCFLAQVFLDSGHRFIPLLTKLGTKHVESYTPSVLNSRNP
jgi:hypothetical protein